MFSMSNGTVITVLLWATFNTACTGTPEARADDPEARADASVTRSLGDVSRAFVGFRISPVQLDLRHKNLILVGLGSYLVNATGDVTTATRTRHMRRAEIPFRGNRRWSTALNI